MGAMLTLPLRAARRARDEVHVAMALARTDAVLASYPKSGRTWFRFILAHCFVMAAELDYPLDLRNMFGIVPNLDWDRARGIPAYDAVGGPVGAPLVAVTHQRYRRMALGRCPIIFMVRDPRDVMVSAYFHATRHKHRYAGDIDSFVRDPGHGLPTLIGYLNSWVPGLRRHRHHVLAYERLSADPAAATVEILEFLGLAIAPDIVARAVEASQFDAMRELELERGIAGHDYDRSDPAALRARRGAVHAFGDYLSRGSIDWIDARLAADLTLAARELLLSTLAEPRPCGAQAGGAVSPSACSTAAWISMTPSQWPQSSSAVRVATPR